MYLMDYDSVKMTNYVQRFCIIPRVRNGVAEDEKFLTLEILDKINVIIQ